MEESFKPKPPIELDPVGLYYSLIRNSNQPATFCISVHLKEDINPEVLQVAVNDLMKRLPFLNVCLKKSFFNYYNEILEEAPIIKNISDFPVPCSFYGKDKDHMLQVFYGKKHFTVEVMHCVCDGRGLSKITTGLLVHYFELLDVKLTDKTGIVNCSDSLDFEEAENAYKKFADLEKIYSPEKYDVYHSNKPITNNFHVISQKFDLGKIKAVCKAHDATITEYLLGHIFEVIREERDGEIIAGGKYPEVNGKMDESESIVEVGEVNKKSNSKTSKKSITAMIPIDCRTFFPSKTLRNFVSAKTIAMPEEEDFSKLLEIIYQEFEKINKDFILEDINSLQKTQNFFNYIPLILKKLLMKPMERFFDVDNTTTFSNLGLIKLPPEINQRLEMLEFIIGPEEDAHYAFSCIAFGNVLTLTINLNMNDDDIAYRLIERLNKAI